MNKYLAGLLIAAFTLSFALAVFADKDGEEFSKYGIRIKLVRTKGDKRLMTRQGELFLYQHVQERKFRVGQTAAIAELLPAIKKNSYFVVRTGKAEYYISTNGQAFETSRDETGKKTTNKISFGDFDLNRLLAGNREQLNDLAYSNASHFVYNLHGDGVRFNVFINGNMIYTNTDKLDLGPFSEQLPINRFLKPGTNSVRIGIFASKNSDSGINMSIIDTYQGGKALIPEGPLPLNKEWLDFSFDLPPGTVLEKE